MSKRSKPTVVEKEKTTVNLPVDVKRAAQKLAIDRKCDLQDLIADGLRLILKKETT